MEKINNKESKGPGRAPRTRAAGAAKSGERRPYRSSEKREDGERPRRTFVKREGDSERPRRTFVKREGDSERPRRTFVKREGDSERPRRTFVKREGDSERPRRTFVKREGDSERPRRSFGRSEGDSERPRRSFGRSEGDSERPRRTFGKREGDSERPRRSFGRGEGDSERPRRSFGRGEGDSERPRRSFGRGEGSSEKPRRSFGRGEGDSERPRRSFGRGEGESERPRRSFGRSEGESERRRRSFGRREGNSERPRRSFGRSEGDSERPRRSFGRRDGEEQRGFTPRYRGTTEDTPKPRKPKAEGESGVRLNKYISNSGICSRREADEYIQAGLVKVNDVIITELGTRVFQNDVVKFNDETIRGEEKVYIVMNKPKDFVTTTSDPHAEKTVMDLIAGKCHERVYPVGRLDKSTTGVLLLTNDGDLTDKLTHPSFEKKKIYQVTLDKNLKKSDFDAILSGVTLEDGPINADNLSYIDGDEKVLGIEIHSGRNRIVRRLFE